MNHRTAASTRLGCLPEQIVDLAEHGGQVCVLVDYGIGGIKKFWLDLADLSLVEKVEPPRRRGRPRKSEA